MPVKPRTRVVVGYDESDNRYTMIERERWDTVYTKDGSQQVQGWEGLLNTKRLVPPVPLAPRREVREKG